MFYKKISIYVTYIEKRDIIYNGKQVNEYDQAIPAEQPTAPLGSLQEPQNTNSHKTSGRQFK